MTHNSAPADHPMGAAGARAFIHVGHRGVRRIRPTTETAGTSAGTLTAGLEHHPIDTPTGRMPGLMMPRAEHASDPSAPIETTPGTTLAAIDAMRTQDTFTRGQVAYLIALAYETGRRQTLAEDLAETVACWDAHATPKQTRQTRITARLAHMQRASGPPRYHGGPVDWETSLPTTSGDPS